MQVSDRSHTLGDRTFTSQFDQEKGDSHESPEVLHHHRLALPVGAGRGAGGQHAAFLPNRLQLHAQLGYSNDVVAAPFLHGNTRFTLDFRQLRCDEETDWDQGTNSDEPYILFLVANLRTGYVLVERTEGIDDMDTGETRTPLGSPRLWGPNDNTAAITNATDMIILAAVMENDASEPGEIVSFIQPILAANLLIYINNGSSRATIVTNLRRDMDNAIDLAAVASGPTNPDNRLGSTQELALTHANLDAAAAGGTVDLSLRFRDSGEDATYRVFFRLLRAA